METTHEVYFGDAREMTAVADECVDLVVTSPPYPMIDMWDEAFSQQSEAVADALAAEDGDAAFEAMHAVLETIWEEVDRVVAPAGTVCINIGDATRKMDGDFRLFPNHARIIDWFTSNGYDLFPDILWRKPSNRATSFMGSGMVPPNAYVSYEHEYILVFRKGGGTRRLEPNLDARYESAYFWEERNEWFSDIWTDVTGVSQELDANDARDRTAAFPFTIPYRLINMYSIYGDTVLDPFLGTATTSVAALCAGRNSIGYEYENELADAIKDRMTASPALAESVVNDRLCNHYEFVTTTTDLDFPYDATHYPFSVKTKQEQDIRFYTPDTLSEEDSGYKASYTPVTWTPADQ